MTTRFTNRDSSGNPLQWSFSLQHLQPELRNNQHQQPQPQNNLYSTTYRNTNTNRGSRYPTPDYDIGMEAFHANIMAYQQNMRNYQHNMYDYIALVESEMRHRYRRSDRIYRRSTQQTESWPRFTTTTNDLFSRFADHFQNVVVAPTENQIANATRSIVFNDNTEYLNTNCPITLENFTEGDEITQIINCGHVFHGPAIQNWFRTNVHCPVCRYDIRNHETEVANHSNDETPHPEEGNQNSDSYSDNGDSEAANSNSPHVDELVTNITNSLGNLIQNYFDNETTNETTTINSNQVLNEINRFVNQFDSTATSLEFEFPLLIYRDLSGNRRTFI